jgi:hypothetical protein
MPWEASNVVIGELRRKCVRLEVATAAIICLNARPSCSVLFSFQYLPVALGRRNPRYRCCLNAQCFDKLSPVPMCWECFLGQCLP